MIFEEVLKGFLSGAIAMGYLVCGTFFIRFWKKIRDDLFRLFAYAFWLLAFERVILTFVTQQYEYAAAVYLIRLVAFALIALAIIEKNRERES